ncbi:cell wall-binding repeat-containing protein [Pontibacillus salicampi]|uniref:Cell wall-binding repeat-containing protein n=1 Tax=Pontibacillus salicampi TaxID=1449801 RepID=A0ABV6LSP5_9BACI
MKMLKPIATVASASAIALGLFAAPTGQNVNAAETDFDLTIVHTNDTHAHWDNAARRATVIDTIRSDRANSLLLDAGDNFSGTLYYNQYKGKAAADFLNILNYDAVIPGNHEFDDGPKTFADFIKMAEFPILSSNIDYSKQSDLNALYQDEIGMPGDNGKIYPASIMDVNGEKVGLFGLTTEETTTLSSPGKDLTFQDHQQKAEDTIAMLEAEGVDKIVAITHLGYTYDQQLAQNVEGLDVIVGGHSHTKVDNGTVYNEDSEPTIVVQADEYGNYVGDLQVTFDDKGVLTDWNEQLVEVDAEDENGEKVYAEDADVKKLVEELQAPLEEMKKEKVGETSVALDGVRENVRQGETNLGNLITDSMLAKAKDKEPATSIAFTNGGGIRASVDSGEITLGEVLTVMPFGNTLVTLDLTGEELMMALENGVSDLENMGGRFLQVSGMKYSFDRSEEPNSRILNAMVKTENGYEKIEKKKTYKVATNAFIANGGDGYEVLNKATEDGRITELFFADYEVFNEYLKENDTVAPKEEGRIVEKTRVNGTNRYETAVEVSKSGWTKADTVVIARADEFADALAGAPLAYKYDAPILLTDSDYIVGEVKQEIERLGAKNAIVLGGPNAISNYSFYQLRGMGLDVDRVNGTNRYETAAAIAARLDGNPENVVIADGSNYPDALAVAPHAARNGYPILLAKGDELPESTDRALRGFDKSIIVGGPGAVSEKTEAELPNPTRYNGTNRYETAAEIANAMATDKGKAYVSTGENFADALSGSVLAAKQEASMILVNNKVPKEFQDFIQDKTVNDFQILGGPNAVSQEVVDMLQQN